MFYVAPYHLYRLKGHQIIGELRHIAESRVLNLGLKGHQIIGELRPAPITNARADNIEGSPDHW